MNRISSTAMSRDRDNDMPDALHDRLQAETPEDRAALETLWRRLGDVDPTPGDDPDLADEWDALQDRRPEVPGGDTPDPSTRPHNGRASAASSRHQRSPSRPRRSQQWARGVGTLALILIVAVGALWIWRHPVTVSAPAGQQRTATLPDGSTVELNSGTTLTYQRDFQSWPLVSADRRTVQLRGEAFFSVEDGSRPFVVETGPATITVEGTRFNVRARPALDSTTAVTLAEGRVRVAPRSQPANAVVLDHGGETSRVESTRATVPTAVDLESVLAWRTNGFAATGEPLVRVLHELEQRYDTSIRLHESVTRPRAALSLYYPNPTPLTTVLRDLCTALDLNFRPTSNGYEIFSGP
jgi:ferric-dicitrate binding protein FerR (iron transport regulator)